MAIIHIITTIAAAVLVMAPSQTQECLDKLGWSVKETDEIENEWAICAMVERGWDCNFDGDAESCCETVSPPYCCKNSNGDVNCGPPLSDFKDPFGRPLPIP